MACSPQTAQQLLNYIIRKNMVMLENLLTNEYIDGVLLGSDWDLKNHYLCPLIMEGND